MAKERSIPKRLSGGEALDSMLFKVREGLMQCPLFHERTAAVETVSRKIWERMSRHGHFHSHKAYQAYAATVKVVLAPNGITAHVDVLFKPAMSFTPPLTDEFEIAGLENTGKISSPLEIKIEIPIAPPNQVREDAGMPLPIVVEQNGQLVEKFVKIAKVKGLKRGNRPPRTANMSIPTAPGTNPVDAELVETYGIQTR